MKTSLSLILVLFPLLSFANKTTLKVVEVNTYLSHLSPSTVTCKQGNNTGYITPSYLFINSASVSIPTQHKNIQSFVSDFSAGTTCREMIAYFNRFKNEFGTIPVKVKITFSKWNKPHYSTYSLTNERGENVGSRSSTFEVYDEVVIFKVGDLEFVGSAFFQLLK
jgi:hypothetical protein